jgi:hypothetical protein
MRIRGLLLAFAFISCNQSSSSDGSVVGQDFSSSFDFSGSSNDLQGSGNDLTGGTGDLAHPNFDALMCGDPDAGNGFACKMNSDCPCGASCSVHLCVPAPRCGDALLNWEGPVTNTDGSCLRDLGGFKIYWGQTQGGPYPNILDVGLPCALGASMACGDMDMVTQQDCGYRITGLTNGTWYFAVSTYNVGGTESSPSNEASKVISCP